MIEHDVSLKNYCSYRTGGKAELFTCPQDIFDLKVALKFASDNSLPLTVLGTGYNVLIADKKIKGLVLSTRCLNRFTEVSGSDVYAGAGEILDRVVMTCIKNGLSGVEALSGIPGSVGGAVRMNAGAFGTEIKDVASAVGICGLDGKEYIINAEDVGFGYRQAANIDGIVTWLRMRLEAGKTEDLLEKRAIILKNRNEKQPLDKPSCGSVFKRPAGGYAGALIEECGLKGFTIGGAQVSEKHANFIVNNGNAKSEHIYNLINHVQKTVEEKTGVKLEREVRFIGF